MALPTSTEYGVTETGFVRKRLDVILNDLFDNLDAELGVSVSRKADSLIGVLLGVFASEIDMQWQLAEKDYYDRSPLTASEGAIDNTLTYTLVTRKTAESSYFYALCVGTSGTYLPTGTQLSDTEGYTWTIDAPSYINGNNCIYVQCDIDTVVPNETYGVIIDGEEYLHKATSTENKYDVFNAIIDMIEKTDNWGATTDDDKLVLVRATDMRYGDVVQVYNMTANSVGSPIKFVCDTTGEIEPSLYTVTTMNTIVNGWTSVTNPTAAYLGRDAETTTELRDRYNTSVYSKSIGMVESIYNAVGEVDDVTSLKVLQNRTDEYANSMNPHSIKVIVEGGDDTEIAKAILDSMPCGIDTNGDVSMQITDSAGIYETVRFSRPYKPAITVQITLYAYDEEQLPIEYENLIKEQITTYGSSLEYGVDIIPQRFLGDIYDNVVGIMNMKIKMKKEFIPIAHMTDEEKTTYLELTNKTETYNSTTNKTKFWEELGESQTDIDQCYSVLSEDRKKEFEFTDVRIPMDVTERAVFKSDNITIEAVEE